MAAVRDVTERRRVEAKALLYRQAREEVRARDEFLSVASHELRTPVTALHVQLQMLQRVVERIGRARARSGSGSSRSTGRSAGWPGWSRRCSTSPASGSAGMELSREPVDVSALAREVAAPYQADLDLAHGSSVQRARARAGGRRPSTGSASSRCSRTCSATR